MLTIKYNYMRFSVYSRLRPACFSILYLSSLSMQATMTLGSGARLFESPPTSAPPSPLLMTTPPLSSLRPTVWLDVRATWNTPTTSYRGTYSHSRGRQKEPMLSKNSTLPHISHTLKSCVSCESWLNCTHHEANLHLPLNFSLRRSSTIVRLKRGRWQAVDSAQAVN